MNDVKITKLPLEAWREFKDFRIFALKTNPLAFGETVQKALVRTEEQWQERMKMAIEGKQSSMVFAKVGDRIVGMQGWYRSEEDLVNGDVQFWGAFVHPDFRRKGIAKMMLDALLREVRENKEIRTVRLAVNEQNEASLKFCISNGFVEYGKAEEMLGDGKMHTTRLLEFRLDC